MVKILKKKGRQLCSTPDNRDKVNFWPQSPDLSAIIGHTFSSHEQHSIVAKN